MPPIVWIYSELSQRLSLAVAACWRYKSVGKLSSGHQAAIMKLAIDDTDTADGNICVVTGAKDHYVKVSAAVCH